jgi:hypothetical protein
MAGTISVSADMRWSAASWLFDWVLRTLARDVTDKELAASMTGTVDENLGWLSVDDLACRDRDELARVARESLVGAANRELSNTLAGRDEVIAHLRELIDMIDSRT